MSLHEDDWYVVDDGVAETDETDELPVEPGASENSGAGIGWWLVVGVIAKYAISAFQSSGG